MDGYPIYMCIWVALIEVSVLFLKRLEVKREMGDLLVEESWREGKEDGYDQDTFYAYIFFKNLKNTIK